MNIFRKLFTALQKPKPPFAPYFNQTLNEQIDTEQEQGYIDMALEIKTVKGLKDLFAELEFKQNMNPAFRQTRECVLTCKAIQLRSLQLRKSGKAVDVDEPEVMPMAAPFTTFMYDYVVGSEFDRRFFDHPRS